MKAAHSSSLILMLAAGVLGLACDANDSTQSGSSPAVTPPVGTPPVGTGATPGGGGADAGSSTAGGSAAGNTAGGFVAGGTAAGTPGGGTGLPGGATAAMPVMMGPCEKQVRTAGRTVPDFMIVLDRSGSMRPMNRNNGMNCLMPRFLSNDARDCENMGVNCDVAPFKGTTVCGGTGYYGVDRWTPAVEALKSLTASFEKKVNFGLTVFPGEPVGNGPDASCTAGNQRVPVGLNNAAAIAAVLGTISPNGSTPTGPTLEEVLRQIKSKQTSPDEQIAPQYVLLVTDGAPTCPGDGGRSTPEAHAATITAIDKLFMEGIKTYVIGYDASVDPMLASALTEFAMHGGTKDFYAVQDGPSLVSQFTAITGVVAECSYKLDKKPDDPKYVRVELDKQTLTLGDTDGWSIDGQNVTIQGAACTRLRDGTAAHTLAVTVECVPIDLQ